MDLYAYGKKLDFISSKLKTEANALIKWLKNNEMVANPSKSQISTNRIQKNLRKT